MSERHEPKFLVSFFKVEVSCYQKKFPRKEGDFTQSTLGLNGKGRRYYIGHHEIQLNYLNGVIIPH